MGVISLYVKVGANYIRFSNGGANYKEVTNRMDATSFPTKQMANEACRKAGIKTYKFVSARILKR